jgi:tetratricopeptide repeat protein
MLSALFSRPRSLTLLVVALCLTACASRTPPPAVAPSSSPAPARASLPSATASPTSTLTKTPRPAATLSPTPTPIPPSPTFEPTLLPATPAAGPEGYRLRKWTAQDALAAIAEGEDQTPFDATIEYLITIEREALRRFPEAVSNKDILWNLAYREADPSWLQKYPIHDFLLALEAKLNSGEITPATMDGWLQQYNFWISATYPATNLFGDGQDATIYSITIPDVQTTVIILTGSRAGGYHLFSVRDHWYSLWHQYQAVSVTDHNGNGQPEIQLIDDWRGTGGNIGECTSQLSLYEWRGSYLDGRFVNLARGVAEIESANDGECDNVWEFSPPSADGAQHIISVMRRHAGGYSSPCTDYELRTIYAWTGLVYEWDGETANMPNPSDPPWCAVLWADWAGGLNDRAVVLVNAWLQTWPTEIDKLLGPSAQDYFRLKLGTWYALRGEAERAQTILRMVRDYPTYPQSTIDSQMAGAYLENYEAGLNPVRACGAVYRIIENAQLEVPPGSGLESVQGWPYNVCDLEISFQKTILTFAPHDIPELINWLGAHQVAVWVVKQADLNDDGVEDWVAVLRMPGGRLWTLWALIRNEKGLNAVLAKDYLYPDESFSATLMHLRAGADSAHVNVFILGDQVSAFQIIERQGSLKAAPFPLSEFESGQIPLLSQDEKIARVEQALFETGDIPEALGLLKDLVAGPIVAPRYSSDNEPDRVKPRLLYLLGLAYELSGDERAAVQAYWQLWHDYPHNPYTLMARRKLEAITP